MRMEMQDQESPSGDELRLKLTYDVREVRMIETPFGTQVELEGATAAGEPGGPALPAQVFRMALPPLSEAGKVSVRVARWESLSDRPLLIAPLQLPQPGLARRGGRDKSADGDERKEEQRGEPKRKENSEPPELRRSSLTPTAERDADFERVPPRPFEPPRAELYQREFEQPRPVTRLVATEMAGVNQVAVIEVNPVQVNRKGQLLLAAEIEVSIQYFPPRPGELARAAPASIVSRTQASRVVDLARLEVLNPELIWDFSPLFPELLGEVDYLVITDNQRWDATAIASTGAAGGDLVAAFERLAGWKRQRGLRARVVTITDIVNGRWGNFRNGAADLQDVIRRFVRWAHQRWGLTWLLLGGDTQIVPVRRVPGASEGHIDTATANPPEANRSFWTGTFLKMNVDRPGTWFPANVDGLTLVRADNGMLIPFDGAGTSGPSARGWYFTTSDSYATRSTAPTRWVRVNGPSAEVNTRLQWLYNWNLIPTDLYYASLIGPNYGLAGQRDWDLNNNGIYGQHTGDTDPDGVAYRADVSVGRAAVDSGGEAEAWVDKVLAYERFRRPDGTPLDSAWTRRMLIVSENWGGRFHLSSTTTNPPEDWRYHRPAGESYALLRLGQLLSTADYRLLVEVTSTDIRLLPYNRDGALTARGWYYARSATDLSRSEISITLPPFGTIRFPIPTQSVVVRGAAAELTPQRFIFDHVTADGSLRDQEELRSLVQSELTQINSISRLYEDTVDLTPAQQAAAPAADLTEDRLRAALNAGQHFVSLSGHGSGWGCCKLGRPMAQNLSNGFHSFIGYADSCLTNEFDGTDSVSEDLLRNPGGGAVAYVGNSRFSWIGVGDNFQRGFFRRLRTVRHLGLLNDSRCGMVNESTGFWRLYNKWQIFSLNLMGDPEMPVWLGPPATMRLEFLRELDLRNPLEVRVTTRIFGVTVPLSGVLVHARQGGFERQGVTNSQGRVTISLSGAQLGDLEITATRIGYLPVLETAAIVGPAWISGTVILIAHQHADPGSTYVRLELQPAVDAAHVRGWHLRRTLPDYSILLDAVTDAYISGKPISLFVASVREGGTAERFRFGSFVLRPQLVDTVLPDRLVIATSEVETALTPLSPERQESVAGPTGDGEEPPLPEAPEGFAIPLAPEQVIGLRSATGSTAPEAEIGGEV